MKEYIEQIPGECETYSTDLHQKQKHYLYTIIKDITSWSSYLLSIFVVVSFGCIGIKGSSVCLSSVGFMIQSILYVKNDTMILMNLLNIA
jgi:hypothetical protein